MSWYKGDMARSEIDLTCKLLVNSAIPIIVAHQAQKAVDFAVAEIPMFRLPQDFQDIETHLCTDRVHLSSGSFRSTWPVPQRICNNGRLSYII